MMRGLLSLVLWALSALQKDVPLRWDHPPFVVEGEAYKIVNREPIETLDVIIAIEGQLLRTRLLDPNEVWAPVIPFGTKGRDVVIRIEGMRRSSALYTVVVP